jgi:hypothetical protein
MLVVRPDLSLFLTGETKTTVYTRKVPEGTPDKLADHVKPGDSVVIPAGSKG